MWDEDTEKALATAKDKTIKDKLLTVFQLRREAKALEDSGKDTKKAADVLIEDIFTELNVEVVKSDELGSIKRVTQERKSYKIDAIKEYLIGHGVSPTVVKNAISAGMSTSESMYFGYWAPRKKKGGN